MGRRASGQDIIVNVFVIKLLFRVRLEVLAAVLLKIRVFWNVTPCRWASVS